MHVTLELQLVIGSRSREAGWLTRDGVKAALAARGIQLRDSELETAFEALDPDQDNNIQFPPSCAHIGPHARTCSARAHSRGA